jgi:hypothetical protein
LLQKSFRDRQLDWFGDFREALEEAGALAGMTGSALLFNHHEKSVGVAIIMEVAQVLDVARRFTLLPELGARAAPIVDKTCGQRAFERLTIHVGQHQNPPSGNILHDGGN